MRHFSAFTKHIKPQVLFVMPQEQALETAGYQRTVGEAIKKHVWFFFSYGSMLLTSHNEQLHAQRQHPCKRKMSTSAIHKVFAPVSGHTVQEIGQNKFTSSLRMLHFAMFTGDRERQLPAYRPLLAKVSANNIPLKHSSPWEVVTSKLSRFTSCVYS